MNESLCIVFHPSVYVVFGRHPPFLVLNVPPGRGMRPGAACGRHFRPVSGRNSLPVFPLISGFRKQRDCMNKIFYIKKERPGWRHPDSLIT